MEDARPAAPRLDRPPWHRTDRARVGVQVKYFGRHKGGAIPRWRARRSRSVADPSGRIAVVVRHRPGDRGDGGRCACRALLATLRVLQPAFPNVVYPQYRLGMRAGAREGGGM